MEEDLQRLVEDFLTQKQILLVQVKKGILSKEQFLREVLKHIEQNYHLPVEKQADLLKEFEQYVFGYSRLSPLMDDGSISDIRVVSHDCIRIKREGKRMDAGIAFASEKEYRQFIDYSDQKSGEYFESECNSAIYGYGKSSGFYISFYTVHADREYIQRTLSLYS